MRSLRGGARKTNGSGGGVADVYRNGPVLGGGESEASRDERHGGSGDGSKNLIADGRLSCMVFPPGGAGRCTMTQAGGGSSSSSSSIVVVVYRFSASQPDAVKYNGN